MREWFAAERITHVVMESTGSYWVPVFNILEGQFIIVLANPEEVKNRKGHKTDRKDAEHLADLLRHDHIRASYIPPKPIRDLRDLTRRRLQLIQDATRERNRVEKLLEHVNVKIGNVLSDVFGVSGQSMLLALLDGKTTAEQIAHLARGQAKRKIPELTEALEGHGMRDHERFRFCRNSAILLFFGLTARCWKVMRQTLNPVVAKVLKRLHYPLDVILLCVRWYSAYPLSLRNLEEMMAERGISVDHSTVHRWAIKLLPVLGKEFRRTKRKVGMSWRMDETYIKVKGEWKYLYRAVDKAGDTVDFLLRAHRDKAAARRFFEQAIEQNGAPEKVTIDKSGSNAAALEAINAGRGKRIVVRQVKYLNNIVEQDHRAIKRRARPMLGFKDFRCARILLSGIEIMHMIRKGQMKNDGRGQTPAQLFYSLAA
jgi:transposase-like protein